MSNTATVIDRKLRPPTADELASLQERGYETWGDYFVELSQINGVSIGKVMAAVDTLGLEEAFDGIVTTLEDESDL